MRSPHTRLRLVPCTGIAIAATLLTSVPAHAAIAPPTILTAGIDVSDQLFATWSLAPGTAFDFVEFATVPDPDASLPLFFAAGNFAGFSCAPPPASCSSLPTSTSYTAGYPTARDRRYFLKVASTNGTDSAQSAIWVIDEAKPLIPGEAPLGPPTPTGIPATGREFSPAPAPPPVPAAALTVPKVPAKLASLRSKGVKVKIGCTAACTGAATLSLDGVRLGRKTFAYAAAGIHTITVKPNAAGLRRLRGRSRARVKISGTATPVGGAKARVSRTFTVRR